MMFSVGLIWERNALGYSNGEIAETFQWDYIEAIEIYFEWKGRRIDLEGIIKQVVKKAIQLKEENGELTAINQSFFETVRQEAERKKSLEAQLVNLKQEIIKLQVDYNELSSDKSNLEEELLELD